ncbi:hypothetical protein L3Q82_010345, partial [Scortum barcoo]
MSLGWPGNTSSSSGFPPEELEEVIWGEGSLGISAQTPASVTQVPDKWRKMDGWMDGVIFASVVILSQFLEEKPPAM